MKIKENNSLEGKSWEPVRICLLNSTGNPANFHPNWAGLALLFGRQILEGSKDVFFSLMFLFDFLRKAELLQEGIFSSSIYLPETF